MVGGGTLAVALRAEHPLRELTPEAYAACEHVIVSRRGHLRDQIDDLLEERGLTRRVVACVPTGSAAFRLVERSDLLVAVPVPPAADARLRILPLPLDVPPADVVMSWHRRYDDDGAHAWFRALVRDAVGATLLASG